jgi:hypothetical protein
LRNRLLHGAAVLQAERIGRQYSGLPEQNTATTYLLDRGGYDFFSALMA